MTTTALCLQAITITAVPASRSVLKFEGVSKKVAREFHDIEGKIVSLSIETKVAIAVATGFVLMVVGAMAQG